MRASVLLAALLFSPPAHADPPRVTIRSGRDNGAVVVDGQTRAPLEDGVATVTLPPGDHEIEILRPRPETPPFPVQRVVGGTLVGMGVVSLLIAAGFYNEYRQNQDDATNPALRALYPASQTPDSLCNGGSHPPALDEVCRLNDESKKHSLVAVLTASGGVLASTAGIILLLTQPSRSDAVRVEGTVGAGTAGMTIVGRF